MREYFVLDVLFFIIRLSFFLKNKIYGVPTTRTLPLSRVLGPKLLPLAEFVLGKKLFKYAKPINH